MRRFGSRRRIVATALGVLGTVLWLGTSVATAETTAEVAFTAPGIHMFTVPVGVSSIAVGAVGAVGGGCNGVVGGDGDAVITSTTPVSPGEQLLIGVGAPGASCASGGSGGVGGGGAGGTGPLATGGGGGGASLVGVASPSPGFSSLLVVAGGGGGAGGSGGPGGSFYFGGAGGNAGSAGSPPPESDAQGGGAGTDSAGGAGGSSANGTPGAGSPGSFGVGGVGAGEAEYEYEGGGGGGGGYYGGGGGGHDDGGEGAAGGGGGSTFVIPGATIALGPAPVGPPPESEPGVVLEYGAPTADLSASGLSAGAYAFPGTQPQGTAGTAEVLELTNGGSAPLVVSGVEESGTDPADYLVENGCQQPVAVSGSCTIEVRFAPHATGASSATLTITSNSIDGNDVVSLSGTGGSPSSGATGPAGPTGATGAQGPAGATGATGAAGLVGASGMNGPQGLAGAIGAQGPPGTNGAPGPAGANGTNGEIELVTCTEVKSKVGKKTVTQKRCTTKLTSSPVSFTTGTASASISRAGHVYATGSLSKGKLVLRASNRLRAGRYTLKLTTGTHQHTRTTKQTITIE
jgi:hypothetical protein